MVEPDDSTDWNITAYWRNGPNCNPGEEESQTASATVTWNGSAWVLSNVVLTASIVDIDICQGDTCSAGGTTHSWEYTLIVDIEDPGGPSGWNLRNVKYATTSVDDGHIIDEPFDGGNCAEGTSVSPTTQTFTAWDDPNDKWRSARCPFNCNIVGGSINLTYQ